MNDRMSRLPMPRAHSDAVEIYVLDHSTLSQLGFCTFLLLGNWMQMECSLITFFFSRIIYHTLGRNFTLELST